MKNTVTITVAQWQAMQTVSEPTATCAKIKQDSAGRKWLWVSSGKRVEVRSIK